MYSARALRETFDLAQRLGAFAHLFKELRIRDAVLETEQTQLTPDVAALIRLCLAAVD